MAAPPRKEADAMAATKIVTLYPTLATATPWFQVTIPAAELSNLKAAIESGSWYSIPANPSERWNMAGVAHYVVTG